MKANQSCQELPPFCSTFIDIDFSFNISAPGVPGILINISCSGGPGSGQMKIIGIPEEKASTAITNGDIVSPNIASTIASYTSLSSSTATTATALVVASGERTSSCQTVKLLNDTGLSGKDTVRTIANVSSWASCCSYCANASSCAGWTWHPPNTHDDNRCTLMSAKQIKKHSSSGAISGSFDLPPPSPAPAPTPVQPTPPPTPVHPTPAGAKNLLFMIADDLRPDLGTYGQGVLSPNIDSIAKRGLRFDRAYCQISVCAPSRNSIFSGRRPDTSGVWNFIDWFRNETAGAQSWISMPQFFKTFGYAVHGMGKTYHGCTNEGGLLSKGYCDIPASWTEDPAFPYFPYVREHCPQGSFCEVSLTDEPKIFDYQLANHTIGVLHALVARRQRTASPNRSIDTRDATDTMSHPQPFALFVGFKKPHAPWGAPSRFFGQYNLSAIQPPSHPRAPAGMPPVAFIHNFKVVLPTGKAYDWGPQQPVPTDVAVQMRRGYYAAISFMDEQVGKILTALRELDLEDSTVVVFTSDHGYHLGEHGEWEKKANFELTNRVPLIIAAPHKPASHGTSSAAITDLVDLYPTLVSLCGLTMSALDPALVPSKSESTSLAPLFNAPAPTPTLSTHTVHTTHTTRPSVLPDAPSSQLSNTPHSISFSQYPRCGKCTDEGSSCNNAKKSTFTYMGYSSRDASYRYTLWLPWDGAKLVARWSLVNSTNISSIPTSVFEELYGHDGDDGTDFDAFENQNLLGVGTPNATVVAARARMVAAVEQRFRPA
jgi:iduronate 2-sulfatase